MMSVQRYTMPTVLFLLAACSANPAPVRLSSDAAGRRLLVGEWAGSYQGQESGLKPGVDRAVAFRFVSSLRSGQRQGGTWTVTRRTGC